MGGPHHDYNRMTVRLLDRLSRHIGVDHAVGMADLYEHVFERPVADRINDTRNLRKLITRLRLEGVPIASISRPDGGGYYLPKQSEIDDYVQRLQRRGIQMLAQASKIRQATAGTVSAG